MLLKANLNLYSSFITRDNFHTDTKSLQIIYFNRRVANGGNGLRTWMVAANILNKISRTAENGKPSSLGFWSGVTSRHRRKLPCYEMLHRTSERTLVITVMNLWIP